MCPPAILTRVVAGALIVAISTSAAAQPDEPQKLNTLSRSEAAAGWKLLFDGTSSTNWRGYKQKEFPSKGWSIEGGTIRSAAGGGGGDIITTEQYDDFELALEFKLTAKANSGIIFRCTESADAPWMTGPEFQILDDRGAGETADSKHSVGGLFDLAAPGRNKFTRPAGEWNQARIRLKDGLLQHFLNGRKVVELRIDDAAWRETIARSKFASMAGFGQQARGHICLQDHGDEVWFRNIKVRDLSASLPGQVTLFDGSGLGGWTAHLNDNGRLEDAWSIVDGVLICKGQPIGYIRTEKDYTNFVLKLEWRFNPVTRKAGNSGVLVRVQAPDKVWPRSIEAQLQHENAGDFWNIDEFQMTTAADRLNGRNTRKTHFAERPLGEWNEYEIIVDHDRVRLVVNGELLNEAWDVEALPGKIALQSEGAEIHFRNIRLAPID